LRDFLGMKRKLKNEEDRFSVKARRERKQEVIIIGLWNSLKIHEQQQQQQQAAKKAIGY